MQRFTKRLISKKPKPSRSDSTVHPSRERMNRLLCIHTVRHDSSRKGHDSASRNNCIDFKNKVFLFFCFARDTEGYILQDFIGAKLKKRQNLPME